MSSQDRIDIGNENVNAKGASEWREAEQKWEAREKLLGCDPYSIAGGTTSDVIRQLADMGLLGKNANVQVMTRVVDSILKKAKVMRDSNTPTDLGRTYGISDDPKKPFGGQAIKPILIVLNQLNLITVATRRNAAPRMTWEEAERAWLKLYRTAEGRRILQFMKGGTIKDLLRELVEKGHLSEETHVNAISKRVLTVLRDAGFIELNPDYSFSVTDQGRKRGIVRAEGSEFDGRIVMDKTPSRWNRKHRFFEFFTSSDSEGLVLTALIQLDLFLADSKAELQRRKTERYNRSKTKWLKAQLNWEKKCGALEGLDDIEGGTLYHVLYQLAERGFLSVASWDESNGADEHRDESLCSSDQVSSMIDNLKKPIESLQSGQIGRYVDKKDDQLSIAARVKKAFPEAGLVDFIAGRPASSSLSRYLTSDFGRERGVIYHDGSLKIGRVDVSADGVETILVLLDHLGLLITDRKAIQREREKFEAKKRSIGKRINELEAVRAQLEEEERKKREEREAEEKRRKAEEKRRKAEEKRRKEEEERRKAEEIKQKQAEWCELEQRWRESVKQQHGIQTIRGGALGRVLRECKQKGFLSEDAKCGEIADQIWDVFVKYGIIGDYRDYYLSQFRRERQIEIKNSCRYVGKSRKEEWDTWIECPTEPVFIALSYLQLLKDPAVELAERREPLRKVVQDRGIKKLYHFTQARNLDSIFEHGILSRNEIYSLGIDAAVNDNERWDRRTNGVSVSISGPNYQMLYALKIGKKNRGETCPGDTYVLLELDPSLLYELDCAFYPTNAASNRVRHDSKTDFKSAQALDNMFADGVRCPAGTYSRAKWGLNPWETSDPQAEVMVFEKIPAHYIKCVIFETEEMDYEYSRWVTNRSHIPFKNLLYDDMPFKPRRDYSDWSKGMNAYDDEMW